MGPMFQTEMFIDRSKTNLHDKILFGKITHRLCPEMMLLVNCKFGNEDSKFHAGPRLTCY